MERENEKLKLINEMGGMICDINEKEIASHIEDGTLKNFCETWRVNMRRLILHSNKDVTFIFFDDGTYVAINCKEKGESEDTWNEKQKK